MQLDYQIRVVRKRSVKGAYRNTDYVNNKVMLPISRALFNEEVITLVLHLQSVLTISSFCFLEAGQRRRRAPARSLFGFHLHLCCAGCYQPAATIVPGSS